MRKRINRGDGNQARSRRLEEIFRQPMKFFAIAWHYSKKAFFFKIAASSADVTPSSDMVSSASSSLPLSFESVNEALITSPEYLLSPIAWRSSVRGKNRMASGSPQISRRSSRSSAVISRKSNLSLSKIIPPTISYSICQFGHAFAIVTSHRHACERIIKHLIEHLAREIR